MDEPSEFGDAVPPIPDLLVDFLAGNDVPCPRCGYNLRGLRTPQCPECGDTLQLQVGLVDPKLGAFIALLVALCVGFGGSSLLGLIAIANATARWWGNPSGILLLVQWVWTAAALPFTIRNPQKFRRLEKQQQWTAAGIALGLVLVTSLLIILLFDD